MDIEITFSLHNVKPTFLCYGGTHDNVFHNCQFYVIKKKKKR